MSNFGPLWPVSNVSAKLAKFIRDVSRNREQEHSFENIVLHVESFLQSKTVLTALFLAAI